ncbi:hypothetical protein [Nocardia wallacei]|uniref:hypothetical protein n=1 Tax=Nocardia wallacei TaxID=480035 RepID=UPI002457B9EB|nr:hypothetical protein [Nocardia wallacei]
MMHSDQPSILTEPVPLGLVNTAFVPTDQVTACEDEIRAMAKRYGFPRDPEIIRIDDGRVPPVLGDFLMRIVRVDATAVFIPNADHVGGQAGVLQIMGTVLGTNPPRVLMRGVFFTEAVEGQQR